MLCKWPVTNSTQLLRSENHHCRRPFLVGRGAMRRGKERGKGPGRRQTALARLCRGAQGAERGAEGRSTGDERGQSRGGRAGYEVGPSWCSAYAARGARCRERARGNRPALRRATWGDSAAAGPTSVERDPGAGETIARGCYSSLFLTSVLTAYGRANQSGRPGKALSRAPSRSQ